MASVLLNELRKAETRASSANTARPSICLLASARCGTCVQCSLRYAGIELAKWLTLSTHDLHEVVHTYLSEVGLEIPPQQPAPAPHGGSASLAETGESTSSRAAAGVGSIFSSSCTVCRGLLGGIALAWAIAPSLSTGSTSVLYNTGVLRGGPNVHGALEPTQGGSGLSLLDEQGRDMLEKLRPGQGTSEIIQQLGSTGLLKLDATGLYAQAQALAQERGSADSPDTLHVHVPSCASGYALTPSWPAELLCQLCSGGYDLRDGLALNFSLSEAFQAQEGRVRTEFAMIYAELHAQRARTGQEATSGSGITGGSHQSAPCLSPSPKMPQPVEVKEVLKGLAMRVLGRLVYCTDKVQHDAEGIPPCLLDIEQAEGALASCVSPPPPHVDGTGGAGLWDSDQPLLLPIPSTGSWDAGDVVQAATARVLQEHYTGHSLPASEEASSTAAVLPATVSVPLLQPNASSHWGHRGGSGSGGAGGKRSAPASAQHQEGRGAEAAGGDSKRQRTEEGGAATASPPVREMASASLLVHLGTADTMQPTAPALAAAGLPTLPRGGLSSSAGGEGGTGGAGASSYRRYASLQMHQFSSLQLSVWIDLPPPSLSLPLLHQEGVGASTGETGSAGGGHAHPRSKAVARAVQAAKVAKAAPPVQRWGRGGGNGSAKGSTGAAKGGKAVAGPVAQDQGSEDGAGKAQAVAEEAAPVPSVATPAPTPAPAPALAPAAVVIPSAPGAQAVESASLDEAAASAPPARQLPLIMTCTLGRGSAFVSGRYAKLARGLSQTPWYVSGQRRDDKSGLAGGSSVEELLGDPIALVLAHPSPSACSTSLPSSAAAASAAGGAPAGVPFALLPPPPAGSSGAFLRIEDGSPVLPLPVRASPASLAHTPRYKFHSAGREDVDVRMLGSGRPFVIELLDARPVVLPLAAFPRMQVLINAHAGGRLAATCVSPCTRAEFVQLQAGAEDKRKRYVALCWASQRLTQEHLTRCLAGLVNVRIAQKTPIRVLHRRSLMTREKVLHSFKTRLVIPTATTTSTATATVSAQGTTDGPACMQDWEEGARARAASLHALPSAPSGGATSGSGREEDQSQRASGSSRFAPLPLMGPPLPVPPPGSSASATSGAAGQMDARTSPFFLLHLETSAGTYVKESVHGDLGRTSPSVAQILGLHAADILSLDVVELLAH